MHVRPRLRPRFANLEVGMPFGLGKIIKVGHSYITVRCVCGDIYMASKRQVDAGHGGHFLYHCGSKDCKTIFSKLRKCWRNMINRCYNGAIPHYVNYGKRGIKTSMAYKHNITAFISDALELGWKPGLTIDRRKNNLGYFKANIRFITHKANCNNKRNTTYLDLNGDRLPYSVVAEKFNIHPSILRTRLRNGWSLQDALVTPVQVQRRNRPSLNPTTHTRPRLHKRPRLARAPA